MKKKSSFKDRLGKSNPKGASKYSLGSNIQDIIQNLNLRIKPEDGKVKFEGSFNDLEFHGTGDKEKIDMEGNYKGTDFTLSTTYKAFAENISSVIGERLKQGASNINMDKDQLHEIAKGIMTAITASEKNGAEVAEAVQESAYGGKTSYKERMRGGGKTKTKTIQVYSFDELSDEAQEKAIEAERESRYSSGQDYAQWATDDDYLFEPKNDELIKLFGKDFYKKLNEGQKYKDKPLVENKRKNIYFDFDRDKFLDISEAINVRDDRYFMEWLGLPKELIEKIYFEISTPAGRNRSSQIEFFPEEPDYTFTKEEEKALSNAEDKFNDYIGDILTNIQSSIEDRYSDETIRLDLEESDEEFMEDGSKSTFREGGGIEAKKLSPERIQEIRARKEKRNEEEKKKIEERWKTGKAKTRKVYFVQGNYGSGWDDLTSHDTGFDAAKERKVYDENESYPHRVISRHIKREDYEKGNYAGGGPLDKISESISKSVRKENKKAAFEFIDRAQKLTGLDEEDKQVLKQAKGILQDNYAWGGSIWDKAKSLSKSAYEKTKELGKKGYEAGKQKLVHLKYKSDKKRAVKVFQEAEKMKGLDRKEVNILKRAKGIVQDYLKEGGKPQIEENERIVHGFDVDEILRHFLIAGLWASYDDNEESLDANYTIEDVDKHSQEEIVKGITKFINDNHAMLKKLPLDEERIGHDLFLDSQGHGVGFWDRNYIPKEDGKILSKSAETIFPSDSPYVQDGKVYFNTRTIKRHGGSIGKGAKPGDLKEIKKRLEHLRKELRAERISYGELAELQSLSKYIEPDDVELLQAAGVEEKHSSDDSRARGGNTFVPKSSQVKKLGQQIEGLEKSLNTDIINQMPEEKAKMEKSLKALKAQYDDLSKKVSAKEKIALEKGKFYLTVPSEYKEPLYQKLRNMGIKVKWSELNGTTKAIANSQKKRNRIYSAYASILKKAKKEVPALETISGKH